jgi:hypothetical protein
MYVNELPGEGVSATEMAQYLDGVNANDVLELRVLGSTVLAAKFARFRVISSVDNGAYRTFEVVYVDHNGTIDNYDLVALSLFPSTIASPFVNDRTYSNIGSGFYIQPLYVGPAVFSTRERARGWRIPLVAGWTFAGITYSVVSQGSGTTIRAAVYSDIGVKVSATEVSAACGAAGTVNLTFSGNWTVPTTGEYIIGLGMTGGDATLTGATPIPQDLSTWSAQSAIVNPAAGASEAQSVISAGMPSTWNDGAAVLTDIALNPIAALRKA